MLEVIKSSSMQKIIDDLKLFFLIKQVHDWSKGKVIADTFQNYAAPFWFFYLTYKNSFS